MEMDSVLDQLIVIGRNYRIDKLVLFGSRARGDHSPYSDYDIAVFSNHLSALDKAAFCSDVDDIATLKKIDIVFVHDGATDDLMTNIAKDGVILL